MPSNFLTDDVVLPPGEVIDGKYEIIAKIGQGGMGVVYKARDPMKREVALKMLSHVDEKTIQRFRREAVALGSVKHRAVIRVDSFGESPLGPYLVVEYVHGRDLGSVAKVPLPIEEAVDLTLGICSGVSACHAADIVHRDLKPSNIRVKNVTRWSERVKILDFGLALTFDSPILKAYQARITNLGSVPGTPRYVAPELLHHQTPTPQCDQYGIASMAYLLLTGRAPFQDLEGDQLLRAIMNGDYLALRLFRAAIPPELQAAVARGLSVDPAERYPSVSDFALSIVPHATPSLRVAYTRYFTNAQHIDRRLIEPVSAFRKPSPPSPPADIQPVRPATPKILAPYQEPIPREVPAAAVPPRLPSPLPQPAVPGLPEASPAASIEPLRRKSKGSSDYATLFIFVCGILLGASLTVGGFLCFLLYQHHAAFCAYTIQAPASHGKP